MIPDRTFLSVPAPSPEEIPVGGRFGSQQLVVDMIPDDLPELSPESGSRGPGVQAAGIRDEDIPHVLDLNDMARLLRLSPFTIRAHHKAGRLPPINPLTRRLTWAKETVLPWLHDLQDRKVRRRRLSPIQSKGVSLTVGRRKSP